MKLQKFLFLFSLIFFSKITIAQSEPKIQLIKEFKKIDRNGNEVITVREMETFYKNRMDAEGKPINGKQMFYGLDANRNRIITFAEYDKGFDRNLAEEFSEKWKVKKPKEINEQKKDSLLLKN